MGWSAGTFTRARNWTADDAGGIEMEAVNFDQEDDNFEAGINNCLTKDGQNTPTADLAMGSQRHTGVGNATTKDSYASAADVIDQGLVYYVDSGAADVYAVTPDPSIGAYGEGQRLVFRATNTNTGASTLNANALGAIAIQTNDGNALTAGMVVDGGYYEVTYDADTIPDRWVLTSHSFQPVITAGGGLTGGGTLPASMTVAVGAGTGITVNADDIEVDESALDIRNMINGPIQKYKTIDEAVTSSSTLQDDNHLTEFALTASQWYSFEANIVYDQNGGDIKLDWVFTNAPVAGTGIVSYLIIGNDGVIVADSTTALTSEFAITTIPDSGVDNTIRISGSVQANTSTGGTFKLQWAQNTISGNATTMSKGSWVRLSDMT